MGPMRLMMLFVTLCACPATGLQLRSLGARLKVSKGLRQKSKATGRFRAMGLAVGTVAAGSSRLAAVAVTAAGNAPVGVSPVKLVLRAFVVGVLLCSVALSAKGKMTKKQSKASEFDRLVGSTTPTLTDDLLSSAAAPEAAVEQQARPVIDVAKATELPKRAQPPAKNLLGAFRKKAGRAIELEELLTSPAETELEGTAITSRRFAVAIAGLVSLKAVPQGVVSQNFLVQLIAPWVALKEAVVAEVPVTKDPASSWRSRDEATSHYDAGLRLTTASEEHSTTARTAAAWRRTSDKAGVLSHFDYGLRLTSASTTKEQEPPAAPSIFAPEELLALQSARKGLTDEEAAEAFANVANALIVPMVDTALKKAKNDDDDAVVESLASVAQFATQAGALFAALDLVAALKTPVVYEGRASKSNLQSIFAKFAAKAVSASEGEPSIAKVDDIDVIQAILKISDKQADRLSEQVVAKVVEKMMADMTAAEQAEAMAASSGDPAADAEAQLAQLEELVASGSLSGEERAEIKNMFAKMMGLDNNRDVDGAIRAAAANKKDMDPQSRRAIELIQQLI